MSRQQKSQKRLIKKTVIPVRIQDDPTQLRGVVRFSTETSKTQITPLTSHIERKKNIILYKNLNKTEEDDEEEDRRKKELQVYEVTLNPLKIKNKQFRFDIPINRGHKSIKSSKANQLFYTFHFSNSEGRMNLLNGQYEAKMEAGVKKDNNYNQRLETQLSRLDNRRKEAIYDGKQGKRKGNKSDSDN